MESEEHILMSELNEKIFQIFSDFMTRVIKFEELVAVGSRLLVGFHQRLEFIRRPPINKTSELIERIFRANETRRVLTYVEAGCVNAHDSIQNISNSKCIVNELEGLVKEVTGAMRTANESKPLSQDKVTQDEFGPEATLYDKEETVSSELPKPEHTDYAAMMSVIYSMVKLDYIMQSRNKKYRLPNSKSSSAARGENLRPMFKDRELTKKKVGHSSMSSAAFMGSRNCRISPLGSITLAALDFFIVAEIRLHE
ncbi:unnamed protein product [Camellia sinensis]